MRVICWLFFFAVCNNRPVRVIGRAGKRPEITVVAANNLCHLRPWQWRPAQKSKLDWLPLLRVLLAKYDRLWEKNWNSRIPGAWYGGQVLYRRPNFSEFRTLEMINFWSHFSITTTHFKAFRKALSSVMGRRSTPCVRNRNHDKWKCIFNFSGFSQTSINS